MVVLGPAKLVSVWLVTNANMPGFRLLEICDPGEVPSGLAEHDESEVVLQYLESADDDAEELDDFILTALQVQSWMIAEVIHRARIVKRSAQKILGGNAR